MAGSGDDDIIAGRSISRPIRCSTGLSAGRELSNYLRARAQCMDVSFYLRFHGRSECDLLDLEYQVGRRDGEQFGCLGRIVYVSCVSDRVSLG